MITGMLDWRNIDFVLLDMDGTLLDLHFDNYFWQEHLPWAYARRHNVPHALATRILTEKFAARRGTLEWYCVDFWSCELQLDIVLLKQEIQDRVAIRPGVHDFLLFLRRLGKHTVLLTNAHPKSLALKMQLTGLAWLFDELVSSHALGFPKESPVLWKTLAVSKGIDLGRSLFIDDTETILDVACKAGVRHVIGIASPDSKIPPGKEEGFRGGSGHRRIRHFDALHRFSGG